MIQASVFESIWPKCSVNDCGGGPSSVSVARLIGDGTAFIDGLLQSHFLEL